MSVVPTSYSRIVGTRTRLAAWSTVLSGCRMEVRERMRSRFLVVSQMKMKMGREEGRREGCRCMLTREYRCFHEECGHCV